MECSPSLGVRKTMAGPELVPCKHCDESGTCNPGKPSCGVCIGRWRVREQLGPGDPTSGLICSVCWGKGLVEASAAKWNNRFPFILASGLVLLGFALLFLIGWTKIDEHQALTFVGTLLGSITGFYFGGERGRLIASDARSRRPQGRETETAQQARATEGNPLR